MSSENNAGYRPLPRGESPISNPLLAAATLTIANVLVPTASVQAQSTSAPATNSESTTNTPTQLPGIVVTGQQDSYNPETVSSPKYTEPLRDIPQTITVVPRAVFEEQGATSLRDVLRNVPGISMQAGEGGGGLPGDNLSIRGFSARSDIYVDGVRDYGAYSRDPFNIEQVEVTKGPSSAVSGRGTAGGSINLVTKTPKADSFYDGTLGFGTDDYKRATLDLNQSLEFKNDEGSKGIKNAAFRLNAMWNDADAPGRDVVENNRWAVAPSLAFGLGTPTRVTLSYVHMTQDNVPDYGIPWVPANTNPDLEDYSNKPAPVDFDNFYGLKNYDFEDIENDSATARIEHDFGNLLTLRNVTSYGRTYRNSAITAPRFASVNTSTLLNRQLQRREIENQVVANQTDGIWEFETGPIGHSTVTGIEYVHELQHNHNSAQTTNQPQTDVFNPNPNDLPYGPMPPITTPKVKTTADTVGVYAFDTLKFGEQWQLSGGLRWDHVEAESGALSSTDNLLSWRAGLVFKPRRNGSIYFGYGTSFNSSIDGNTGLVLSDATNSVNNVNLEPEETRNFELGTKWDFFEERLSIDAALFRTEKINARTTPLGGGTVTLDGEQVVQGVELGIAGRITKDWQVFGGYTYMHSEIEESGNPTDVGAEFGNTPEHSFSLWTTYALPWNLDIGFGAQYVGDRFNNQSSNANARVAPGYWLYDAMIAYEVNKHVSLRLNIYNLADEDYIDRVGGGHFIPGAGRSAVLTANFTF